MTEKPNSSWAMEIFGTDDVGVIPADRGPATPPFDELWDFRPATGAGDKLIRKLERAAVVSEISGCTTEEAMKIVALAPASKDADAVISEIERDAFSDEVVGPCPPAEKVFGPDSGERRQPPKVAPLPTPTFSTPLAAAKLLGLVNKAQRIQKSAPQRKAAIKGIVDAVRNKPVFMRVRDDDRWNTLVQSIENFVALAIFAP